MPKLTLSTIGSRYGSIDALNANFDAIEAAIENTLSRDGTSPNAMEAALNMDGYDILNARTVNTTGLRLNGVPVTPSLLSYTGLVKERQTALAGQTAFTLTEVVYVPGTGNLTVYVNGVYQDETAYTQTSTSVVTFATPLELGDKVDFVVLSLNQNPDVSVGTSVVYTPNASSLIESERTVTTALNDITNNETGATRIGYLPAGTGAVATNVQSKLRESVSVLDFGADPTATTDSSAAIIAALAAASHVVVPPGTYRCDTMIELNTGKTLQLMGGATLRRMAAHSTSTDPVVWIKGSNASFFGAGQASSTVITESRAPKGVVRLGHKDMTESHGNVTYCTLKDMQISGALDYGQTSGDPDVALYMPNPQFGGLASYFHNVFGLRVQSANYGIWLHGWANANTISNIQGYRIGNTTLGVNTNAFIYCNGALDNAVSNCFFHQSSNSIGLLVNNFDNTSNGGVTHSVYANSFSGMVFEQGGASAIGLKSVVTIGNSFYEIRPNVSLGNSYPVGFLDANTLIDLNAIRAATVDGGVIAARTSLTSPAATFSTTGDVTGTFRGGQVDGLYVAKKVKRVANGTNTATLTFTLSNNVQASIWRLGYIKITGAGGDRASNPQSVAWFLYGASALGAAFPTLGALKDSGGDIAPYTISMASGVLTVATTLDDIVVEVEYGFTNPNVNVT